MLKPYLVQFRSMHAYAEIMSERVQCFPFLKRVICEKAKFLNFVEHENPNPNGWWLDPEYGVSNMRLPLIWAMNMINGNNDGNAAVPLNFNDNSNQNAANFQIAEVAAEDQGVVALFNEIENMDCADSVDSGVTAIIPRVTSSTDAIIDLSFRKNDENSSDADSTVNHYTPASPQPEDGPILS